MIMNIGVGVWRSRPINVGFVTSRCSDLCKMGEFHIRRMALDIDRCLYCTHLWHCIAKRTLLCNVRLWNQNIHGEREAAGKCSLNRSYSTSNLWQYAYISGVPHVRFSAADARQHLS